jgi:UDP-N-acetylmuramoyl-tripeptide--D-alanyl-D-alanine ligase
MASLIPQNQARFTHQELIDATRGQCPPFDGAVVGVGTDSRADLSGGLFLALRGEHYDGHRFAAAAVRQGARVLVVEEPVADTGAAVVLRVASTQQALADLARHHRRRWRGSVIAVAGSVGKTTTRTSVAALAGAAGHTVHCPPGNLNNLIGVPMVLLGLTERHSLGVVELGTSITGEIERLTAIADPDVGVLTRIALEHSERLGDLDAIEQEEGALLRGLRPDAVAVVNADDARCLRQLVQCRARRQLGYGLAAGPARERSGYLILGHETTSAGMTQVRLGRPHADALELNSPLLGLPGAYALCAALAANEVLLGRSLTGAELARALASPALGEPGRLTPTELGDGSLVLDDTYNSSPASVQSSLVVARELADRRGSRLLLVLGEMRELGAASVLAHQELGADIVAARPAFVVAFGGDARGLLEVPARHGLATEFTEDARGALESVAKQRRPGDVILVKASRGLRAERVVEGLCARADGTR